MQSNFIRVGTLLFKGILSKNHIVVKLDVADISYALEFLRSQYQTLVDQCAAREGCMYEIVRLGEKEARKRIFSTGLTMYMYRMAKLALKLGIMSIELNGSSGKYGPLPDSKVLRLSRRDELITSQEFQDDLGPASNCSSVVVVEDDDRTSTAQLVPFASVERNEECQGQVSMSSQLKMAPSSLKRKSSSPIEVDVKKKCEGENKAYVKEVTKKYCFSDSTLTASDVPKTSNMRIYLQPAKLKVTSKNIEGCKEEAGKGSTPWSSVPNTNPWSESKSIWQWRQGDNSSQALDPREEYVDVLHDVAACALEESEDITNTNLQNFIQAGGDLLNVSQDLDKFIENFDRSSTIDVLENMSSQPVGPAPNSQPAVSTGSAMNTASGVSENSAASASAADNALPKDEDEPLNFTNGTEMVKLVEKVAEEVDEDEVSEITRKSAIDSEVKEAYAKYMAALKKRLEAFKCKEESNEKCKEYSKPDDLHQVKPSSVRRQAIYVDGANDTTSGESSSSAVVVESSEEEQKVDEDVTFRAIADRKSELEAEMKKRQSPKSENEKEKKIMRVKRKKKKTDNANNFPSGNDEDIVSSGGSGEHVAIISISGLKPFNFDSLLDSFEEFETGVQETSSPVQAALLTADSSMGDKHQQNDGNIASKPMAKTPKKRGRPPKPKNDTSPPKKKGRRPLKMTIKKVNDSAATANRTTWIANRLQTSSSSGNSDNSTDSSSLSQYARKVFPTAFASPVTKKGAPKKTRLKRRREETQSSDSSEIEDMMSQYSNNQSCSTALTGCEPMSSPYDDNLDIKQHTLSSSELMSSEAEVDRTQSYPYKPYRPADSDPLWSSTTEEDPDFAEEPQGQPQMLDISDSQSDSWEDKVNEERNSIEDLRGFDTPESIQEMRLRMRERNHRIALQHSRVGLEDAYKPNMLLADVFEVAFLDLDETGKLDEVAQEMMDAPLTPVPQHIMTVKGDILLSLMGHTITMTLKRYLEDNGIDLAYVHNTRISRLQRRTADALAECIRKTVDSKKAVLEYDSIKRIAVVIPGKTTGMWWVYELETYLKVLYLMLIVEKDAVDNSAFFWNKFSKKMASYGVYRDEASCKNKETYFVKKFTELKSVPRTLEGLNKLIYHVMGQCYHVNPPALGSVSRGIQNRTATSTSSSGSSGNSTSRVQSPQVSTARQSLSSQAAKSLNNSVSSQKSAKSRRIVVVKRGGSGSAHGSATKAGQYVSLLKPDVGRRRAVTATVSRPPTSPKSAIQEAALPEPAVTSSSTPSSDYPVAVTANTKEKDSQNPWADLKTYAPGRTNNSMVIAKELLQLAKDKGQRDDTAVTALVGVSKHLQERLQRDNNQQQQNQQLMQQQQQILQQLLHQQQLQIQRQQEQQQQMLQQQQQQRQRQEEGREQRPNCYPKRHMCKPSCPLECRKNFDF